jgi:hypothetical protein
MRAHNLVLALSLSLLSARAAHPCSLAVPTLDGPIAPRDGATAVPTNARVVVAFDSFAGAPTVTTVDLHDANGDVTQPAFGTEGELFIVRPTTLSGNMSYTLVLGSDDFGTITSVQRSFTTTTSDDTTAPVFAGELEEPTYTFEPKAAFGQGFDSCGFNSVDRYFVDVPFPEASDDMGLAGFHVFTVDEIGGRTLRASVLEADAQSRVIEFTEPGTYTFVVEAFDLAGNTTMSNEVTTILLAPIVSCSAAHVTTTEGPSGAIALLVMAIANVRRRGRRRA